MQKKLIEKNLLIVAMAMDIADFTTISGAKYEGAMTQMMLWSICKKYI